MLVVKSVKDKQFLLSLLKDVKLRTNLLTQRGVKPTLSNLFKEVKSNLELMMLPEVNYSLIPLIVRVGLNKAIKFSDEKRFKESDEAYAFAKKGIELIRMALLGEVDASLRLLGDLMRSSFYRKNKDYVINERKDVVTENWFNTDEFFSLAERVINQFKRERKLIIINFAHGSTRAAIVLGLILELNGFKVINLLVRFSIHKSKDEVFKFPTMKSINELRGKLMSGFKVLILDEDVSSGVTLKTFNDYLKKRGLKAKFGVIGSFYKPELFKPDYFHIEVSADFSIKQYN